MAGYSSLAGPAGACRRCGSFPIMLDLGPTLTWLRVLCVIAGEPPQDAVHVLTRLRIGRNSSVADHRTFARVVGGQDERQVAVKSVHQTTKMAHAALDVFAWIEGITHAEDARRLGHKLHQPAGARAGDCARVEI